MKAVLGASIVAGALAADYFTLGAAAGATSTFVFAGLSGQLFAGAAISGATMLAGGIAQAISANRSEGITTRQPAANRQVIYGEQRVGGVMIYESTTGGSHDQYNYVIVLAGHPCNAIVNLYLDGRQVFWNPTNTGGNTTQNGVNFGGAANGSTYTGPNGLQYNFGGLVYCEARYGTQLPGDVIAGLTANDPNWAASSTGSPYVGGCTYVYLKVEYDSNMFPQLPEIKFTVQGRNDIFDPRTNTRGYSQNWANIVADVLMNPEYGANFAVTDINTAQWIAAANLCDEQIPLAAGGTESAYTLNAHFDTGLSPADILDKMLPCAGGRMSYIGGQWYLFPASWVGASYSVNVGQLLATPDVKCKSFRDLCNEVRGTYVAPVYPYSVAGNLYDSNGFYQGEIQNNFAYAWTATDYPAFLEDTTHGYATNQWLVQDAGNPLVTNISYEWVISCATAQRLAKIALRRNRQRYSTTLHMDLSGLQLQPCDVIQFTYPALGWTNKLFEVVAFRTVVANQDGSSDDAPYVYVEVDIVETDSTVFDWIPATDELSPATDLPFPSTVQTASAVPATPTAMTLSDSAIETSDGVVRPQILVSWTAPATGNATNVEVQYQVSGSSGWMAGPIVDASVTSAFIPGVIQSTTYNVQLRATKSRTGAASAWSAASSHTVSSTASSIGLLSIASGVIPSFVDRAVPTGSGTTWTLPSAPNPASSLTLWSINTSSKVTTDVSTSAYTVSGATVTFSTAVAAGNTLQASYRH